VLRPLAALLLAFVVASGVGSQSPIPPAEQQVAAAVLALPADMRAGALVMGYRDAGKLVTLREGKNGMICLALYVSRPDFHVACYHKGLEPFMARGRALRAAGVKGEAVDSARFAEIKSGTLKMPAQGALYTITTKRANYDAATNHVKDYRPLSVVYIPGATPESVGITAVPTDKGPWLMFPGTPKAHIMMTGTMAP
jgi:hypothetical protein